MSKHNSGSPFGTFPIVAMGAAVAAWLAGGGVGIIIATWAALSAGYAVVKTLEDYDR